MKIEAVLFDCDGLMFDTERVAQEIWRQIAREYGVTLPEDVFVAITGVKDTEGLKPFYDVIPHLNEIRIEAKKKRFDLNFWSSFYPDQLNKKGLIELNHYLKENQIPCAVCSSSGKKYVETLLKTSTHPLYFDAVIGGDMVKHGKPDPEIFLLGSSTLQTDPSKCLVLEDSKMGILAAHRAGMHSCFIEDTIHPDLEMQSLIEFQKNDLSEVIDLLKEVQ